MERSALLRERKRDPLHSETLFSIERERERRTSQRGTLIIKTERKRLIIERETLRIERGKE